MNPQNQKLYVGNLNFEANEDQVRELFSGHGDVQEVKIIVDRFSQRSRGFAFVTMGSAEEAKNAKEALNGQPFQGKTLVVDIARSEKDGPRPGQDRKPFRRPRGDREDWGARRG